MGDARLLRRAREVEDFTSGELAMLAQRMFACMEASGGIGLAAPQIGVDLRVVVLGGVRSERYPDAPDVPRRVLVNPEIELLPGAEESGWEGCLSVPGLRGWVPRATALRLRARDVEGAVIELEASGFHARVIQHECDHLDGILYPMRMSDMSRFGFADLIG